MSVFRAESFLSTSIIAKMSSTPRDVVPWINRTSDMGSPSRPRDGTKSKQCRRSELGIVRTDQIGVPVCKRLSSSGGLHAAVGNAAMQLSTLGRSEQEVRNDHQHFRTEVIIPATDLTEGHSSTARTAMAGLAAATRQSSGTRGGQTIAWSVTTIDDDDGQKVEDNGSSGTAGRGSSKGQGAPGGYRGRIADARDFFRMLSGVAAAKSLAKLERKGSRTVSHTRIIHQWVAAALPTKGILKNKVAESLSVSVAKRKKVKKVLEKMEPRRAQLEVR